MFLSGWLPGFASSASSFRSPKSLVASYLASWLAEHFDVDPDAIEFNLAASADANEVLLRAVQLKPQTLAHHAPFQLQGQVDEVAFSWKWGGDAQTSFVREARLTVSGARFRLVQVVPAVPSNEPPQSGAPPLPNPSPTATAAATPNAIVNGDGGYIQRAVYQIVDHLHLNVADLQLSIEISATDRVVVQAQRLHLASLGYTASSDDVESGKGPPLSQRLCLESFGAIVESEDHHWPLLDPFTSVATIRRMSGRRFDGLALGLEVVADMFCSSEGSSSEAGITAHCETAQVRVLGQLLRVLETPIVPASSFAPVDLSERCETQLDDEVVSLSTRFVVSVPGVTVTLPSECTIRAPGCTVHYCVDGTDFTVDGTEGITLHGDVPLLSFAYGFGWCLDVPRGRFQVNEASTESRTLQGPSALPRNDEIITTPSGQVAARVLWKEREINKLLGALRILIDECSGVSPVDHYRTSSNSGPSTWSIDVAGCLAARIDGTSHAEYLEVSLASPSLCVSREAGSSTEWRLTGIRAGCIILDVESFGGVRVNVPALELSASSGQDTIEVQGCVSATIHSVESTNALKDFLNRTLSLDALGFDSHHKKESTLLSLPLAISASVLTIDCANLHARVAVESLLVLGSKVQCTGLQYSDKLGTSARLSGVSASFCQDIQVTLKSVDQAFVPNVASLARPILDATLVLSYGLLTVDVPELYLLIIDSKLNDKEQTQIFASTSASTNLNAVVLPFPVRLRLHEFKAILPKAGALHSSVDLRSIDLFVTFANEMIMIRNDGVVNMRLKSCGDEWLAAVLGGLSVGVPQSGNGHLPSVISVATLHIGPSSHGPISADLTLIEIRGQPVEVRVGGPVIASLASVSVVTRIQTFASSFLGRGSASRDSTAISVMVPKLTLVVSDIGAQIDCDDIECNGSQLSCCTLRSVQRDGTFVHMSNIVGDLGDTISAEISCIESLQTSSFALELPVKAARVFFDGKDVKFQLSSVRVLLTQFESSPQEAKSSPSEGLMSFGVQANVDKLAILHYSILEPMNARNVVIHVIPFQRGDTEPKTIVTVDAKDVVNKMMKVDAIKCSALLHIGKTNVVENLNCSVSDAVVAAGFSSVDWSKMFLGDGENRQETSSLIRLPFARLQAFKVHVSYRGIVVATHDSIAIPEFRGGPTSTLSDVIGHVSKSVLRKAPSLLSNLEVMGGNVVEMSATSAGRMAASASLRGAAVGSVAGLVAVDSVRSAVAKGKSSRNATTEDAYKFGDFTRGVIRSVNQAVTNPKVASQTVGSYAGENKARLAGAAGSGVGMTVGSVLLGPVGLIAGAYLGSQAGEKAFQADDPIKQEDDLLKFGDASLALTGSSDRPVLDPFGISVSPQMSTPVPGSEPSAHDWSNAACDVPLSIVSSSDHLPPNKSPPNSWPAASIYSDASNSETVGPGLLDGRINFRTPVVATVSSHSVTGATNDHFDLGTHQKSRNETLASSQQTSCHVSAMFAVPSPSPAPTSTGCSELNDHLDILTVHSASVARSLPTRVLTAPNDSYQASQNTETEQCTSYPAQNQASLCHAKRHASHASDPFDVFADVAPDVPSQSRAGVNDLELQGRRNTETYQGRQYPAQDQTSVCPAQRRATHQYPAQPSEEPNATPQGYKFGDLTRSIVAKGKQKAGRNQNESYKFGDFTRGLFG